MLLSITQLQAQVAMPDTVCVGTTRLYHVNDSSVPSTYTWKIDGVTQSTFTNSISITWNNPGVYQISVLEHSNAGCDGDLRTGTVVVNAPPVAHAGPDATVCFGTNFRLNGSGGTGYLWTPATYLSNPLIANPIVSSPVAGSFTYVLGVVDANGCHSVKNDSVVVTILPQVKIFAGNDTLIAINEPLQLNAQDVTNSNFTSYSWSPSFGLNNSSVKNPVAILDRNVVYIITARTAEGCVAQDDISIKVFQKPDIFVPTAFTPNGDGLNDVLKVIPVGIKELKYFTVYNRWGEIVFKTNNPSIGWDGKYKSQRQDTYVFVWEAMGIDFKGETIFKKGTVTLIR